VSRWEYTLPAIGKDGRIKGKRAYRVQHGPGADREVCRMRSLKTAVGVLVLAALTTTSAGAGAATPTVHFTVFARTGVRLTDIVWTGQRFLYVENTTTRILAAPPAGMPYSLFTRLPRQVEETRCLPAITGHGFVIGDVYCHSPDNKIYRISANGKTIAQVATLPHVVRSDGALTFDSVGDFGYALVVATGRSGGTTNHGGSVFTVDPLGTVRRVGTYDSPGGADEIAIAPPHFGAASGQVLLTVDAGKSGSLIAMDVHGRVRTLAPLPDGPNPIAALVPGRGPSAGAAPSGLYVTDTLSRTIYFAPAAELAPFAGSVLVGSELRGIFWVIRPSGGAFIATKLVTNLTGTHYNLEGAAYIAG